MRKQDTDLGIVLMYKNKQNGDFYFRQTGTDSY